MRAIIQPNGTLRPVTWGERGLGIGRRRRARSGTTTSSPACRPSKARARIVELLRESGDLIGEPRPITHAVKFYEKGDRPLEIVTSRQWFIKTIEFREALLARGRELQWHPAYMQARLRELGQRPERRLVRQPPAVLRRAVSGLVSGRRRRHRSTTRRRLAAGRGSAADRSVDRRAGRLPRRPARPAGRVRRRSRRHGHLGDLVADAADRLRLGRRSGSVRAHVPDGPAAAGARHHPHVAVRRPCCARSSSTTRCRGRTPRSPAGCSIPTARRCRSRRATSSRRWRCSRSTAPTACATGRRAAGRAPTRRSIPAR